MSSLPDKGCTLLITNIPHDLDLCTLRSDLEMYGTLHDYATPPGPLHVYATYYDPTHAQAALQGLREHRRLVVDFACVDHKWPDGCRDAPKT